MLESEKRIIDEIKSMKDEIKNMKDEMKNMKDELDKKIESEIKKLDKKIESEIKKLDEKIEGVKKELAERTEWTEFRLEGLYSIFKASSFQTQGRIKNLSRRAVPDTSGINSTRVKWTDESLF